MALLTYHTRMNEFRSSGAPDFSTRHPRTKLAVLVILLGLVSAPGLQGCDADRVAPRSSGFTLQILHFSDIDGTGGVADADNFSALVTKFRSARPRHTLLLSSGDNLIPGPEYFAADDDSMAHVLGKPGNGRANIAWLNAMDTQASVVGNHDLDEGTAAFTQLLAVDGSWPGARFPYLAANMDFQAAADPALPDPSELIVPDGRPAKPSSVAGSATIEVGGETIGLVGASAPTLPSITDTGELVLKPRSFEPGSPADLEALAAAIQPSVDTLTRQGINKIILLAHMQEIAIEASLAKHLRDVDVIIAGGSNTVLADGDDRLRAGDTASGTYPLQFESASGEPILLVNVAGDFRYLGRLVVAFDERGVARLDSIDPAVSGAYATDAIPAGLEPNPDVAAITQALEAVLAEKDGNILGMTDVYLEGRKSRVRTEETNLGNLTADANLWLARRQDPDVRISLKNGGGIRSPIGRVVQPPGSSDPGAVELLPPASSPEIGKPAGGISQLDVSTSLRFNNRLTLVTVTAAELADIIEHTLAATAEGALPGGFPQVAGLRFSFDASRAARPGGEINRADPDISGDRLRSLAVVDPGTGAVVDELVSAGRVQGDPNRLFRLVTLAFLSECARQADESCGNGYPFKGLSTPSPAPLTADPGNSGFADTGTEQDALAEYLMHAFPPGAEPYDEQETPPAKDQRIRNLGHGAT